MTPSNLIMIVDDNLDNLKIFSGLLKADYQIKVSTRGDEALRLAEENPRPDLILLDIMMPEMDGYEVCQRLKANPQTRDIPIMFLTAKNQLEDEARGFLAGAVDYLTKPVSPPILWARVKTHLALGSYLRSTKLQLEHVGHQIAQVMEERDEIELQKQRLFDRQQALLKITRIALVDIDLSIYLAIILGVIGSIPWLKIEPRGALFLSNLRNDLVMVAHQGLDDTLLKACAKVPLGSCYCGQAAARMKFQFTPELRREAGRCQHDSCGLGLYALPMIEGDHVLGVLAILIPPGQQPMKDADEFLSDVADISTTLISRRQAQESLKINKLEIQLARNDMIRKLGVAAEFRDTETGMHVWRMSKYTAAIARVLNCSSEQCELIELAAAMHDVGKIGISDDILRKPGKLTNEEFTIMKNHTLIGSKILEGEDSLTKMAREIAVSHHEKWDGTGYPYGLKGDSIPLYGRICAVADVFDALTMERPYKEAWPVQKAMDLILQSAGSHFDPQIVKAFEEALPEIHQIRLRYHDHAISPGEALDLPSKDNHEDEWISWSPAYSVGIEIIDVHHRYLIYWVNHLHRAINEWSGADQIAKGLLALEEYVRIHFAEEERIMIDCGYIDFDAHRKQHLDFKKKLIEFREEFQHNPFIPGIEMVEFLRDWLLSHTLKSDCDILLNSARKC